MTRTNAAKNARDGGACRRLPERGAPWPHPVYLDTGDVENAAVRLAAHARKAAPGARAAVVIARRVDRLRPEFFRAFAREYPDAALVRVNDSERTKTLSGMKTIFEKLIALELDRRALIVAVGGGVLTDMAGFAAAVYKRGIRWMAVPTTLTGQADAALGGKTGVDAAGAKNMIGSFHQPLATTLIPDFLRTLPAREMRAGLAEVLKTGMALNARIIDRVESNAGAILDADIGALAEAIRLTATEKMKVVARDPQDRGERAVLNLGHTVAHAVEAAGGFRRWRHGEAVTIGLLTAMRLAVTIGSMTEGDQARMTDLIRRLGMWPKATPRPGDLSRWLRMDKKYEGDWLTEVVPGPLGRYGLREMRPRDLVARELWSWRTNWEER
ncbi:3-dehydroquinate synthase [bacterium]|nr:3-dehydroquinate synthase [bacterium]